jgi:uncharacterized membrane-anchored protein YhcB (DUF1043 family)
MMNSATDVNSTPSGGSSSNVIQFGSLIGNIILGFVIVILLWRQDDVGTDQRLIDLRTDFNSRLAEQRSHVNEETTQLRADYTQRIDHLEKQARDYASDINQYETLTWLHVTDNDANFKHFGLHTPKALPKPPRR